VALRILPGVKLEKDVRATIKTHGILGDKYIEIVPGMQREAYLEPGGQITQVERQADVDRLLNQLALIADRREEGYGSLSNVLGGRAGEASMAGILESTGSSPASEYGRREHEETLRIMLENTRQLTDNLNRVVTRNDEKVAQVIENLRGPPER